MGELQIELLIYLCDRAGELQPGALQSTPIDAELAARLGVPERDLERATEHLHALGLIEYSGMGLFVAVTRAGIAHVETERRLSSRAGRRWIVRTPSLDWQLANPAPVRVADIREAIAQVTDVMSPTSGASSRAFEQGAAIRRLLESDLHIALNADRGSTHTINVAGDIKNSQVAQGGSVDVRNAESGVSAVKWFLGVLGALIASGLAYWLGWAR